MTHPTDEELDALVKRLSERAKEDRQIQANNEAVAVALKGQKLLFEQGVRSQSNSFAVRLGLDYENCAKKDAQIASDWEKAASAITALRTQLAAANARADTVAETIRQAEREACAKVCDGWKEWNSYTTDIAAAIRARGDA